MESSITEENSDLQTRLIGAVQIAHYPYGCFIVLTLFVLAASTSAFIRVSFSPIAKIMENHYSIQVSDVNWLSTVAILAYVIFFVPTTWIIEVTSLRTGVIVGCLLNTLGSWIKYYGSTLDEFFLLVSGQILCEIGNCFFMTIPSRLAALWFPFELRAIICAVGLSANQLGVLLSFLIVPFFVTKEADISLYLLLQAVFCSTVLLSVLLLFRSEPPSRSSVSRISLTRRDSKPGTPTQEAVQRPITTPGTPGAVLQNDPPPISVGPPMMHRENSSSSIKDFTAISTLAAARDVWNRKKSAKFEKNPVESVTSSVWRILVNPESSAFRVMTLAFGLSVGSSYALQSVLYKAIIFVAPHLDNSGVGSLYNWYQVGRSGFGIVALLIAGLVIDHNRRKHKQVSMILAFFSLLFISCFSGIAYIYRDPSCKNFQSEFFWEVSLGVIYSLLSGFLFAVLLGGFEWAARIQLRVSETVSAGVLFASSQLIALIIVGIISLIAMDFTTISTVISAICVVGCLAWAFVRSHDDDDDTCREQDRDAFGYGSLPVANREYVTRTAADSKTSSPSRSPILSPIKQPGSSKHRDSRWGKAPSSTTSKQQLHASTHGGAFDFGLSQSKTPVSIAPTRISVNSTQHSQRRSSGIGIFAELPVTP